MFITLKRDEVKDTLYCTRQVQNKAEQESCYPRNMKDIESDSKGQITYLGIWWTLGKYDTVVMFEAPDEKAAMNMVLKRADRMEIETLVAVPADAPSPAGPA
jgi:uncharacterized protein with GYD domain